MAAQLAGISTHAACASAASFVWAWLVTSTPASPVAADEADDARRTAASTPTTARAAPRTS